MSRQLVVIALLLLSTTVVGCGGGTGPNPPPLPPPRFVAPVANITIDDAANAGDASDFVITFDVPDPSGISGFRVFFVKAAQAGAFDLAAANAVTPGGFIQVSSVDGLTGFSPAPGATDTDLATIGEGQRYRLFILSVASTGPASNALATLGPEFELTQNTVVATVATLTEAGNGGVSVGPDGNIYVGDSGPTPGLGGQRVFRVTPTGQSSLFAGGPPLLTALGGAWDSKGRFHQASFNGNAVLRIDDNGVMTTFVTEGIAGPVGLAFDSNDDLYVANCSSNTIQKVKPDGTSEPFASSPLFNCPNGITVGPGGNVYVANFNDGAMLQVTPVGAVSNFATLPGGNLGHIAFGNGVFYVTARGAHQIYTVSLLGTPSVLIGSGIQGFRDGSSTRASLSLPNGVALSADGSTLYFNQVLSTQGAANNPTVVRAVLLAGGG